jgi:inner membrane protein
LDNFTHSLAGWALGQAGLKTRTRKGLAALILGANMPDIDVIFGSVPWDPLAMHRGFTHGLVGGIVVMPPILFGLLLLLDRWQVSRGATFKSGLDLHKGWLLALCYIGAITHPLLDLQTTYSVQLLSPFSNAWFHSDSLFIIDAFLWTLLPAAIAWSRWREKRELSWQRIPQVAIAIAVVFITFNMGLSANATDRVKLRHPNATAIFASPPPVIFWRRTMRWREGDAIGGANYDPFHGLGPSAPPVPDNMDDPLVRQAIRNDRSLKPFLGWSILPIASVERERCVARVTISDGRYGEPGKNRSRLERTTEVPLSGAGC